MSTSLATDSNAASQNSDLEVPLRIACSTSKPAKSFTKFLKLPGELQLEILARLLPQPCYFYVKANYTDMLEPEQGIEYTIHRVISQGDPQHTEQTRRSTRTLRHLDMLAVNWKFRNGYIDQNCYALNLRGHGQLYISTTDVVYIENIHFLLADLHFELSMKREIWHSKVKVLYVPLCGFPDDEESIARLNSIEDGLRWEKIDHPLVALLRIFSFAEKVVVAFDVLGLGLKEALNCLPEETFKICLKEAHHRESLECGKVATALDRLQCVREGRINVPEIVCYLNLWDKRGYVEENSDEPSSTGAVVTDASMTNGLAELTS